jgi:transposase
MRGAVQMQVTTIGLDIAKNVFQVHGIDAKGPRRNNRIERKESGGG